MTMTKYERKCDMDGGKNDIYQALLHAEAALKEAYAEIERLRAEIASLKNELVSEDDWEPAFPPAQVIARYKCTPIPLEEPDHAN